MSMSDPQMSILHPRKTTPTVGCFIVRENGFVEQNYTLAYDGYVTFDGKRYIICIKHHINNDAVIKKVVRCFCLMDVEYVVKEI